MKSGADQRGSDPVSVHADSDRSGPANDGGAGDSTGARNGQGSDGHGGGGSAGGLAAQMLASINEAPLGIAMFDRDMRYLAASRRFITDYGLPPGSDLTGRSHYEVFPDLPLHWRAIHARLIATGETMAEEEEAFPRGDGRTDWVRWTLKPWRTGSGAVGGLILYSEVVTTRVEERRALAHAEAAFRAREALLSAVLASTPDLIYAKDLDGRYLVMSEAGAPVHGRAVAEIVGRTDADIFPADVAAALRANDAAVIADGVARSFDESATIDGRWRIFHSTKAPLRAGGEVAGVVGVSVDVTERRESESRFRQIAEHIREVFYVHELDERRISYVSPAYEQVWGRPAAELYADAEDFVAGIHPDDRPMLAVTMRRQQAGEHTQTDYRVVRPDGSVRHIHDRAFFLVDEVTGARRVVGIAEDVTDRVLGEARLRASEAFARSILEGSNDCIAVLDAAGRITYVNASGCCHAGLDTMAGALGQPVETLWPDETRAALRDAVARALAGEVARFTGFGPTAAGEPKWWDVTLSPLPAGSAGRLLSVARDVSEARASAEQLMLLNRELHHRVKNALATVQAAAILIGRSATAVPDFLAALSARLGAMGRTHDLLLAGHGDGATLHGLLETEISPYAPVAGERVTLDGPPVVLPSDEAVALGMAIHELATNAAKHGALAGPGATLRVRWTIAADGTGSRLRLSWEEHGVRIAAPPTRRGFGSHLLDRVLTSQLQARVSREFAADGLKVAIDMPLG